MPMYFFVRIDGGVVTKPVKGHVDGSDNFAHVSVRIKNLVLMPVGILKHEAMIRFATFFSLGEPIYFSTPLSQRNVSDRFSIFPVYDKIRHYQIRDPT